MSSEIVLHDCAHCKTEGTCRNGIDGKTCISCAMKAKEHKTIPPACYFNWKKADYYSSFSGISCGCCGGMGKMEPLTSRMINRLPTALATVLPFVLIILTIIFGNMAVFKNDYNTLFSYIMTLTSSVISAVMTYCFTVRKN